MKCTNFRKELKAIHEQEIKELIEALRAHGGEYDFTGTATNRDYIHCPRVGIDYDMEHCKLVVFKAILNKYGHPSLRGDVIGGCFEPSFVTEVDAKDVLVGGISEIISMMDEPQK